MSEQQTTLSSQNGQPNADQNTSKQDYLITHEALDRTPFHITGNQEKGYFLRLGEYRLTDFKPTTDEVIEELYATQWETIAKMICAIIEMDKKLTTNNK